MNAKVKRVKLVQVLSLVLITIVLILSQVSCNQTGQDAATSKSQDVKYIYLNAEQLKPLGIELSEEGLFYKNCGPKDIKMSYRYFYTIDEEDYVGMSTGCELSANPDKNDSILMSKEMTYHDFYPIFVTYTRENHTFDSRASDERDEHIDLVLPIAFSMSETKVPNRTDTIIFWFKVTESLKKALPDGIIIEDYLGLPDIKTD